MFAGGNFWDQFAKVAVSQSPAIAALSCALIWALIHRRRHPKASRMLALGLVVILVDYAGSLAGAYYTATVWLLQAAGTSVTGDAALMLTNLMSSTVAAAGFVLVAAAVFVERGRPFADIPPEARRHD